MIVTIPGPEQGSGNDRKALRYMTVGRLNYLKKLFTYLRPEKQNEDCLYLNVYSPSKSNYESGKTRVWSLTQLCSVDFSQSRISVEKCVFNKRTIQV